LHEDILPKVIFSPGRLAIDLAEGVQELGATVTLFSPGPVATVVKNVTADLSLFEAELRGRGDTYLDLLKKHPFTFVTLARQVQSELIARAFAMANNDEFDVLHVYTNEEDTALPFAQLCNKPVVFTHHDPFNFLVKYKNVFPKYANLPWISMSYAQRKGMPNNTNWLRNIYHGLPAQQFTPNYMPQENYIAYLGRIVQPKGLHLAIQAVKRHNQTAARPLKLKIAGKHYSGHKDLYWQEQIVPQLDDPCVEYVGFLHTDAERQEFLGNAQALIVPSLFEEPFGMVMIEALACGTPIIGLDSGSIPEVVTPATGLVVAKRTDDDIMMRALTGALSAIKKIDRKACRKDFEARFTIERMCQEHMIAYNQLMAPTRERFIE
jgi:glycosyltransferase involved in cell wall biosynthesis